MYLTHPSPICQAQLAAICVQKPLPQAAFSYAHKAFGNEIGAKQREDYEEQVDGSIVAPPARLRIEMSGGDDEAICLPDPGRARGILPTK